MAELVFLFQNASVVMSSPGRVTTPSHCSHAHHESLAGIIVWHGG